MVHLGCAEHELRIAETSTLAPALRRARARNLDRLRAYRRRGKFPQNTHNTTPFAPCFVDPDGRRCAVASLMDETGATSAVERMAAVANHARIGDMLFSELDEWASESGLTKDERARIQPGYPPTPEQAAKYANIILSVGLVGGLAVASILVNIARLIWARKPRLSTMLFGTVVGVILLYLGSRIETAEFAHTPELYGGVSNSQLLAGGIGLLSVACAVIPLWVRRGQWRPTVSDTEVGSPGGGRSEPPSGPAGLAR